MRLLIFILGLAISLTSYGQYDYSETCIKAHQLISSLRFDEARVLIDNEKQSNPENLVPLMLVGYLDFLTLIASENEYYYDSLKTARNHRIDLLRKGDKESPWYRSSIALENLQWAFARISFGSYINAARDIRRAYLLLEENNRLHPGFLPDQVGLGIMHALIGTIPDNMKWVARMFSMEGSVETGRRELMAVLEKADKEGFPFLKDEALFFLSFIDLNLQADDQMAKALLDHYDERADSSLMLIFSKARILMQSGMTDEAISLLQARPSSKQYYSFYYLDYLTGLAKLNRLDEDTERYFFRFTTNYKGNNYLKSAYQKMAWSALLKGDTIGYTRNMGQVLRYGDEIADGDKLAMKEARDQQPPNTCLLRARLLFDGGYYKRAEETLNASTCLCERNRDTIELQYRLGRISQAMEHNARALQYYEETITLGKDETYYFAANAALQSGRIYENQAELDKAEESYHLCLKMKNTEYKNSISQKAKAGLNRVKDLKENKD